MSIAITAIILAASIALAVAAVLMQPKRRALL